MLVCMAAFCFRCVLLFFFFFFFFSLFYDPFQYGRRAWSASTFSKRLEKVLEPPKVRSRVRRSPRSPITFCLDDSSKFLPFASYPCSGGLSNIARFYKPHMPLFTRHLEWEPTDKPEHRVLVSCVLRRATCIGSLHERYRALEKVFQQVMSENGNLVGEIQRLRELLDGGGQQEDILKVSIRVLDVSCLCFLNACFFSFSSDDFGTRAGDEKSSGARAHRCVSGQRRSGRRKREVAAANFAAAKLASAGG
jgi:hypothetical protein